MTAPWLDHDTIRQAIRHWPRAAQAQLAQAILQMAAPPRGRWQDRLGLLATDQPAPADADIARWREEHRREK
jgi:hypothetical protein